MSLLVYFYQHPVPSSVCLLLFTMQNAYNNHSNDASLASQGSPRRVIKVTHMTFLKQELRLKYIDYIAVFSKQPINNTLKILVKFSLKPFFP